MVKPEGLSCQELVELVTGYVEHIMSSEEQQQFEAHLKVCRGCRIYVDQMEQTIRLTGTLREDAIPPEARDELLRAFRQWKSSSS